MKGEMIMMKRGWMLLLILSAAGWFSGPADARLTVIDTATYTEIGANDSGVMLGGGQGMPGLPVEEKVSAGDCTGRCSDIQKRTRSAYFAAYQV